MREFSLRRLAFIACLSLCTLASAPAQQPQDARLSKFPNVSIANTELRILKSSSTGRDYDIYVHLPDGYAQNREKKRPVVYVLDGQWDFKLLASIYGGLFYDKFIPEMIVVGVTYHGTSPKYDALRAMDYTPTAAGTIPGSGGGARFLAFLKTELLPFIEANYATDPARRVLLGSSLGGLFTLYAMFTEPQLFSGYVAASPAVSYGDRVSFKEEVEYGSKHKDLPARLFVSVGELEELAQPVKEFVQALAARGYNGLKMESRVIEGERHSGVKPEAFNRGLRFIFKSE